MLSDAQFCIDWVKQMGEFTPLTAPNVAAYIRKREEALRAQADAQPVAWRHNLTHCLYETEAEVELGDGDEWAEPLYLHSAPEAAQALSDEEIQALWNEACHDTPQKPGWRRHIRFARSIESAILTRASAATGAQEAIAQLNRERAVDPAKLNMPLDAALRSAATVAEPSAMWTETGLAIGAPVAARQDGTAERERTAFSIDARKIASKVHQTCSLIPGATHYNAAEMAVDAVMEAYRATKQAEPAMPQLLENADDVRRLLQSMHVSSSAFVDADGNITGYKVKTGALHRLFGMFGVEIYTGLPEISEQQAEPVGDERAAPTYYSEIGDAGNQYYAQFKYAHPLPAQWRWENLWNVMVAAAHKTVGGGLVSLPEKLPASIYRHEKLGDLYDRLALHKYAIGYALACLAAQSGQQVGDAEVQQVLNRLNSSDPDFDDCAAAAALIVRMATEMKGPDGYATWKDAAVAERRLRVVSQSGQRAGKEYEAAYKEECQTMLAEGIGYWKAKYEELAGQREGVAEDAIDKLVSVHAEMLEANPYCYFELAYTRRTGWMAWICSNHSDDDHNRKVLARGQGDDPQAACQDALSKIAAAPTPAAQGGV